MPDRARAIDTSVAVVYEPMVGQGGSGHLVEQVLDGFADGHRRVDALGAPARDRLLTSDEIVWHDPPVAVSPLRRRFTPLRWNSGRLALLNSRARGRWAAGLLDDVRPGLCYAFAEVGLEPLQWAARAGVASVLDSPSGHVRHFHDVVTQEYERWCGAKARSHPVRQMVERVEEEYALADRIRAASQFTRTTMIEKGVPAERISVVPYAMDLSRFHPPSTPRRTSRGPLRVCYVGMMAMHKGFAYLLRAARLLGASGVSLRMIGGSVDPHTRRLLEVERRGLPVVAGPARELIPELHAADILVLPSLHDGFGLVVAEAMATELPVIVTNQAGAADWVTEERTGWVIPAGDVNAIAAALERAIDQRQLLPEMGAAARHAVTHASGSAEEFRRWALRLPARKSPAAATAVSGARRATTPAPQP